VVTAAGISAAVLVAGGGAVSYATSRSPAPTYVTAAAGSHSVMATLQATGTTEPSSAATVSFAVTGTVATVPVTMGQKVTAGEVLATLDTTSLKYALATAQGQVANANLTLAQAQSGQVSAASGPGSSAGATSGKTSTAGTGTSGTGSTGTGAGTGSAGTGAGTTGTAGSKTGTTKTGTTGTGATTGPTGSSHSGTGSTAAITAAQRALLATVRKADSLLAKTKADLTLATTLCTTQSTTPPTTPPTTPTTPPVTPTTPPVTPTTPPAPPTTPTTPPTTPTTPPVTPTGGKATAAPAAPTTAQNAALTTTSTGSTTCIQGQQLVLKDESQLLTLQQGLSGQESALDKLISSAAASTGTASTGKAATGTAPTAAAPAGTSSTGTASAGRTATTGTASAGSASAAKTSGGGGSTTVAVSAAQLAADQSAVDAANANLVLAQQQLSQATIVSPFTGVVSSVGLTVGQQATAGSATSAVDVIDPTGHGVTLSVDVTKIPQVKVGDKAIVVPDGSATPLAATVSYVAAAPTSSTSTAYNVQLAFVSNPTSLRDGIQAAVTITTAQAVNALAVPTSAVNHRGAINYVLVLNGTTTKAQLITVGSVGAIYTQVIGGLTAGQRVVLANPNTPIPTSTITGRVARITGGVTGGTAGVLGSTSGAAGVRPGG